MAILNCGPRVSIKLREETSVRVPAACGSSPQWREIGPDYADYLQAFPKPDFAENLQARLNFFQDECAVFSRPLVELLDALLRAAPRRPVAFIKGDWLGERTNESRWDVFGYRELDARQIRILVQSLKARCWGWIEGIRTPSSNVLEKRAAEAVSSSVESERKTLERLNEIADILEHAERMSAR